MSCQAEEEPARISRETLCHRLVELASAIAIHDGMRRDQVEDCALGFVAHILQQQPLVLTNTPPVGEDWLYRCAANWVRNELRQQRRQNQREASPLQTEAEQEESVSHDNQDYLVSLLRHELSVRLALSVSHLSPSDQTLFIHFYLLEHSCQEIAQATGRTPNAIRQALWNLRRRLRALLEKQGLDGMEASDYLHLLAVCSQPEHVR